MPVATSLPGTLQRAASPLATSGLSSSIGLSVSFEPSIPYVESLLVAFSVNIKSFRVPLDRAIREVLVPSIRRNFDEGGRPAWEGLAEATLLLREFYGTGDAPLIRTGQLRRVASQINMWDVTTEDATYKDLPDKVFYGNIQQQGAGSRGGSSAKSVALAPIKKVGGYSAVLAKLNKPGGVANLKSAKGSEGRFIPARPFLMIQPEDEVRIAAIFEEWVDSRIAAVKF